MKELLYADLISTHKDLQEYLANADAEFAKKTKGN